MQPDALAAVLAGLDEIELGETISRARREAARLANAADPTAAAWSQVFGMIAASAEVALLRQRTGLPV